MHMIKKTTTKEKLEVMQAYLDGLEIEYMSNYDSSGKWHIVSDPIWNWEEVEYRVKRAPISNAYTISEYLKAEKEHGPNFSTNYGVFTYKKAVAVGPEGMTYIDSNGTLVTEDFEILARDFVWEDGTPMHL